MIRLLSRRFSEYLSMYRNSIENPEQFWSSAAKEIVWDKPFTTILDKSQEPLYSWFPDGKLNMCYNCVDRHVESGSGKDWAFIYDSPMTNKIVHYTYKELLEEVQKLAGVLTFRHGVRKGDVVLIYMPLIPEAIVAMLACARIGAVHTVVFGGFASKELANRVVDSKPKLIITANVGLEPGKKIPYLPIVNEATQIAEKRGLQGADSIERLVFDRGFGVPVDLKLHRDYDYYEEMVMSRPFSSIVSVGSSHPLYFLHTSGTTGAPKGVLRDTGGYAVALKKVMDWVYGVGKRDVFFSASDIGWVVGHSCITYGPLLVGGTSVIYEGKPVGTPDSGAWWRVIQQHNVKSIFVAPTGLRAIKREDPLGKLMKSFDLSCLKHVGIAGERCDPDTVNWLTNNLKPDTLVNDHWWQTESGWPMISNFMRIEKFEVKPGIATKPVPGWNIKILRENGEECNSQESGVVCVKLPTPPGFMLTLWNNDEGFKEKYMKDFPGYYMAGDEGFCDEDGYFHIMGRTDDVINVAGHRISSGLIEEVISYHEDVAECAVIAVYEKIKGEMPVALVVLKEGHDVLSKHVEQEVFQKVRQDIGNIATLKKCVTVKRLPKTRSGKVLRGTLRKIAQAQEFEVPSTIDDPVILDEVKDSMKECGLCVPVDLEFGSEPSRTN